MVKARESMKSIAKCTKIKAMDELFILSLLNNRKEK
jgi:hypothetical protein